MTAVPKPTPALKEPKTLTQKVHRIPAKVRDETFEKLGQTCHWCREPGGAVDLHHVLRRSQGGKDYWSNLRPVHRKCHSYIHEHPTEAKRRGFLA
jgi:hypothetical protein